MRLSTLGFLSLGLLSMSCGSDNENFNKYVDSVVPRENRLTVGASTVVDISFATTRSGFQDDADPLSLIVTIPNGLEFVNNTSELDNGVNERNVSPESSLVCVDQKYKIYNFRFDSGDVNFLDRFTDSENQPTGLLKFTVRAVNSSDTIYTIGAFADESGASNCRDGLLSEADGTIIVR